MPERRRKSRIPRVLTVEADVLETPPEHAKLLDQTFAYESSNISITGLCLAGHQLLPLGSRLALRIYSKQPRVDFSLRGRVCWVATEKTRGSFFMGVALLSLDNPEAKVWRRFVKRFMTGDETPGRGPSFAREEHSPWL